MATIDYQEARKEIVKLFSSHGADERKIVFWYDPAQHFREDITQDHFTGFHVLVCDRNEFSIKKTIEHDQPHTHFLVYVPADRPSDAENWLLDILMYSVEYYADTVALTMRRLGLTNSDLRRIIERYGRFFDNEGRVRRLSHYSQVNDQMTAEELKLAMLCVLSKASSRSIEAVLTELVFELPSSAKHEEIQKFGLEEFLWDEIARHFNYEGDQKLETLVRKFLFTALLEQKADFGSLSSFYGQYSIQGAGRVDARFFVDKIKTDERYLKLQEQAALELKIEGLLLSRDIACVQEADVFECIDQHIIKTIAVSLQNGSLDYDTFERVIQLRRNSIWFRRHQTEYDFVTSTIALLKLLEQPLAKRQDAVAYIREYADNLWKVDYHYRHICTCFRAMPQVAEAFKQLMQRVDSAYQTKFLDELGREYSDTLTQQGQWLFPGIRLSGDFYQRVQMQSHKKCFVIISDGLRYEAGRELYERLKVDEGLKGSVEMNYAVSPLPSETRFGMATLLPHKILSYKQGEVRVDGMPTNGIQARDAILKARQKSYAAIGYEQINAMSRKELRSFMADKSLVYIFHNVIDNAGEHNEGKVFESVSEAIREIRALLLKLYNTLQISNYYITSDHGFIYRRTPVPESAKYGNIVSKKTTEASKRFLLTDSLDCDIPSTLEFPLTEETETTTSLQHQRELRVICPYGYDLFKTPGGGLQYVHGGASLQETLVPVIRLSELHSAKNKGNIAPVKVRLKSITRKVTNRSFSLEFEQVEKVGEQKQPISCETFIEDEKGEKVSGIYQFLADSSSDDVATRVTTIRFTLMNIAFDRNRRYYLVLRDANAPDEYIEREQFVIDIIAFKLF